MEGLAVPMVPDTINFVIYKTEGTATIAKKYLLSSKDSNIYKK